VAGGDFSFYGHGRLTAHGDNGLLSAEWTGYPACEAQEIWLEREGERRPVKAQGETITTTKAFVDCVLGEGPNIAPPREAAQTVSLTEAIFRSAQSGQIVDVESPLPQ
jgi:predicted dehydrogenase